MNEPRLYPGGPSIRTGLVFVYPEHLDRGVRASGASCPVALALRESLSFVDGPPLAVNVSYESITIGDDIFECSFSLAKWLVDYDQGADKRPDIEFGKPYVLAVILNYEEGVAYLGRIARHKPQVTWEEIE